MSSKNLLVVIGGTQEGSAKLSKFQSVFSPKELVKKDVDVLQMNFLTAQPGIRFFSASEKKEEAKNLGSFFYPNGSLRDLTYDLYGSVGEADEIQGLNEDQNGTISANILEVKDYLSKLEWQDDKKGLFGGYVFQKSGTSARGMTEEVYKTLSRACLAITNAVVKVGSYHNIYVMGHSRGASVATFLAKELMGLHYANLLKRIVLLDPVAKNVGQEGDEAVIRNGNEAIEEASDKGIETHIILKTQKAKMNYESYAPELLGSTPVNYKKVQGLHDNLSGSKVHVHTAYMVHGYMLQGLGARATIEGAKMKDRFFNEGFPHYMNILSEEWSEPYSGFGKIDKSNANDEIKKVELEDRQKALSDYLLGRGYIGLW